LKPEYYVIHYTRLRAKKSMTANKAAATQYVEFQRGSWLTDGATWVVGAFIIFLLLAAQGRDDAAQWVLLGWAVAAFLLLIAIRFQDAYGRICRIELTESELRFCKLGATIVRRRSDLQEIVVSTVEFLGRWKHEVTVERQIAFRFATSTVCVDPISEAEFERLKQLIDRLVDRDGPLLTISRRQSDSRVPYDEGGGVAGG
jgi:hypothetical protein